MYLNSSCFFPESWSIWGDQFEAFPKSLLNSLCTGRWGSLHSFDHEGRIFIDLDQPKSMWLAWKIHGSRHNSVFYEMKMSHIGKTSQVLESNHTWKSELKLKVEGFGRCYIRWSKTRYYRSWPWKRNTCKAVPTSFSLTPGHGPMVGCSFGSSYWFITPPFRGKFSRS